MTNSLSIRLETPNDWAEVENLTREAFWNVYRPGAVEHFVLHCFRKSDAFVPPLDLVATIDEKIVAHVMFARSQITTSSGTLPIVTFGPFSVTPNLQRRGIGKTLLSFALNKASDLGFGAVAICGNSQFYEKLGFVVAKTLSVRYADDPEADYFLIKELKPGFLESVVGTYRDPAEYFVAQEHVDEFHAYEANFPVKEKLALPGQLTHESL